MRTVRTRSAVLLGLCIALSASRTEASSGPRARGRSLTPRATSSSEFTLTGNALERRRLVARMGKRRLKYVRTTDVQTRTSDAQLVSGELTLHVAWNGEAPPTMWSTRAAGATVKRRAIAELGLPVKAAPRESHFTHDEARDAANPAADHGRYRVRLIDRGHAAFVALLAGREVTMFELAPEAILLAPRPARGAPE